jgi:hypothetical protein
MKHSPRTDNPSRFRSLTAAALLALLASLAAGTGTAMAAGDAEFQSAFQQFSTASAGDNSAIDKAADAFDALLKAEPSNPVVMAYAGATTAMKAGTTMLPMKKMAYAEDGMALLDKSLAMLTPASDAPIQRGTPGSLEVRFVAANTFLAVPGFMNRGTRGAKLLNEVLDSPLFAGAPLPFKGAVWMRAATLAMKEQRTPDARKYLNEVVTQNAPQAEAAKARLKEIAA